MMKNKNLIIRYFGLLLLTIGIILNIKMYVDEAYPTYMFYLISVIGFFLIIISFALKKLTIGWQIFLVLLPVLLLLIFLK